MLARFQQVPVDPDQLKHDHGRGDEPFDELALLKAAKDLKLKAKAVSSSWSRLDRVPLPAMALVIPPAPEPQPPSAENQEDTTQSKPEAAPQPPRWVILAQAAEDKVLIHDPLAGKPLTVSRDQFEAAWTGRLIQMTRRASLAGAERKFDFTWFIPALVRYRHQFRDVIAASFFLQLFGLVTPLLFQVVIDKVLVHKGLTTLDVLVIAFIAIAIFEAALGGLRTWVFTHTTNRVDVELGARLFRHLMHLPMAYFQARRVGDTVARVRELDTIREFLTSSALTLVIDLFFTIVFFAVMYYYSPILTAIVALSIPFYVALSIWVTPIFRRRLDDKFKRHAENQAFLVETVTGVETVKALAVEPQFRNRWDEQLAGYVNSAFGTAQLGNVASQIAQLISKVTLALTLYFGAKLVIDGDLSIGQLVAFNMLSQRVVQPILKLTQLWQDFQQARISIERLGDVLNIPTEQTHNPNRPTLPAIQGKIGFEAVTFRYRPDAPEVLRQVQLEIQPGQVVGIVGPSGSGKSTLTKLVQRLYVPESGRVLVDGTDLALVDPVWLRRQVGVVLQENYLFNRTVRDNIALADPAAGMDKVVAAAQQAGAHDFILELAEGYDTIVGERGGTLSGGQRQRIAIARALLTNPRILIFDEATSALDYESEQIIQQNMATICQGRTVMIIAHRLSTVRTADRIITIEKGVVVEDGTHDELLRTGGRYAKLYAIQSGSVAEEVIKPLNR